MQKHFHKIIATGLGTGYAPIAPGTVGAALACLIVWLVYTFFPALFDGSTTHQLYAIAIIIATFFIGVWSSDFMENELGKDPSVVVIDEIIGVWISLLFVPFSWQILLAAFVLFRFFDILKPLGIRQLDQKMPGGWGIMMDDVLAGVYANLILQGILWMEWL